jgi:hypothetical protein
MMKRPTGSCGPLYARLAILPLLIACGICVVGGADGQTSEARSAWGSVSFEELCRSGFPSSACDVFDEDIQSTAE